MLFTRWSGMEYTFLKKDVFFGKKKIGFVTVLGLIKCLKQIKQQRVHLTWAPISELPYNISTMG